MNYIHGNYFKIIYEDWMLYDDSTNSYSNGSSVRVSYHVFDDCLRLAFGITHILVHTNPVVSLWRNIHSIWSLAAVRDLAEHRLLLIPHQQEVHCPRPFNNHYGVNVTQMPCILKSRHWCFPLDIPFDFGSASSLALFLETLPLTSSYLLVILVPIFALLFGLDTSCNPLT